MEHIILPPPNAPPVALEITNGHAPPPPIHQPNIPNIPNNQNQALQNFLQNHGMLNHLINFFQAHGGLNFLLHFLQNIGQWVFCQIFIFTCVVILLFWFLIGDLKHHHSSPFFTCKPDVSVSLDGTGNFTSISDALAQAPDKSSSLYCVFIKKGIYHEQLVIGKDKMNIALLGEDMDNTIIISDGSAEQATINVMGDDFVAVNLTFENSGDSQKGVVVYNEAETSTFYRCNFQGNGSTLYAELGRQFYRDCSICGTQSLISGNAKAIFQNCTIRVSPSSATRVNVIASQGGGNWRVFSGYVFQHCKIVSTPGFGSLYANTYLGSPLGEYSTVVFMRSYMGDLINPAGWMVNKTAKIYYGEFENNGPGSDARNRTHWPGVKLLNASEASQFTVQDFIQGNEWVPKGIPCWQDLVEMPPFRTNN